VAPNVALKKHSKAGAYDHSENKMQSNSHHMRIGIHQPGDERIKIDLGHPFAESPAAKKAGESTDNNGTCKAESGLRLRSKPGLQAPQCPERKPQWRSKAQQVSHEFVEVAARRVEHSHFRHMPDQERDDSRWKRQPKNEGVREAQYQTCTRSDC